MTMVMCVSLLVSLLVCAWMFSVVHAPARGDVMCVLVCMVRMCVFGVMSTGQAS